MKKLAPCRSLNGLSILILMIIFVTCKGPQGEIGPQGSIGTPGTPGAAGPAGPTGPAGTANIIASAWVKIADTAWIPNQDTTYFVVAREDVNITQPILEKGFVMAYYRNVGRESLVFSMPSVTDELTLGFFMRVQNNKGAMNFDLSFFKPRKTPIDFDLEFRWIIIPPNPGGRLNTLDWTNYTLVREELGLND